MAYSLLQWYLLVFSKEQDRLVDCYPIPAPPSAFARPHCLSVAEVAQMHKFLARSLDPSHYDYALDCKEEELPFWAHQAISLLG